MAIQRQTPQFDPTRIVQPTATPIDTYFRPMLRQPEPSSLMQVAEALGGISPQLGRLASDAMAANIAAQKEYGEYEASTEKDPEVLRRKATEAIENSGGIAPWRYQAFLEAYGQRMVRDKYRNALWNNLDDLSNPYNSDGTVRAPTYIAEQMSKMYQDAGIPENSYFINKGAAAARAEADNSFYDRLMAARRQKVLEKSEEVLRDGLQFSIETAHDISSVFGPKGAIKALTDEYYRQGGQDGDKIMVDTVIATARGAAAEGNYDRALRLLRYPLDEKVGERTLGNRYRPELQQVYDQLYERSREAELNEARDTEALKGTALLAGQDRVLAVLLEERRKGQVINLDETQVVETVDRELSGVNMKDDISAAVRARLIDWTRNKIEHLNNKTKREERSDTSALNEVFKQARVLPRKEFENRLGYLLDNDIIDMASYERLRTVNQSMNGLQEVDRQRMMAGIRTIDGFAWTGMTEQQIAADGRAELSAIGDRASIEVMDAFFAEINGQAFRQKYPDEIERSMANSQVLDRLIREKQSQLRANYQTRLAQYDLTTSFDTVVGPKYEAEMDNFMPIVFGSIEGVQLDDVTKARVTPYLSVALLDRYRDAWGSIASSPGEPPMTMEQRKREFYRRVPDIKEQFLIDVRTKPEQFVSQSFVNLIRPAPPKAGVVELPGEGKTTAAPTLPLSRTITPDGATSAIKPAATVAVPNVAYHAVFKSESDLYDLNVKAQAAAAAAFANPKDAATVARHDAVKSEVNKAADQVIADLGSTTVGQIEPSMIPTAWAVNFAQLRGKPMYQYREDGLHVMMNREGEYGRSKVITDKYLAAKAMVGYTEAELLAGRTAEGVNITPAMRDATEFLYFKSVADFDKAVNEYNSSTGKKGVIAERYLGMSGLSFEDFRRAQMALLGTRKPIG
jgi:hypothetical protein